MDHRKRRTNIILTPWLSPIAYPFMNPSKQNKQNLLDLFWVRNWSFPVSLVQFPAAQCRCQCTLSPGWRREGGTCRGDAGWERQDWCQAVTVATGRGPVRVGEQGERGWQCYHGNRWSAFLPWAADAAALMQNYLPAAGGLRHSMSRALVLSPIYSNYFNYLISS